MSLLLSGFSWIGFPAARSYHTSMPRNTPTELTPRYLFQRFFLFLHLPLEVLQSPIQSRYMGVGCARVGYALHYAHMWTLLCIKATKAHMRRVVTRPTRLKNSATKIRQNIYDKFNVCSRDIFPPPRHPLLLYIQSTRSLLSSDMF